MEHKGYSDVRFTEEVATTNQTVFGWLRWADADETVQRIDAFFEQYDVKIFAPSHCNVIRQDMPKYQAALRRAMELAVTRAYDLVV